MIKIKRVYEPPDRSDGVRVLVDRLWPRGLKKEKAHVDHWLKEIAPSDSLRKWYSHDPKKWDEFRRRYKAELKPKAELLDQLRNLEMNEGTLTLLFSSREERLNNAVALAEFLKR